MNDRIYQALTAAGLSTSPLSVLDHASTYASAFFALYDTELLYHEGGKNSQVPLRDVTRIHSDREGVLRVETSERTAVTASLIGYDPGRVQAFFQQVRDVTARAKELPVLPLNQAKTEVASDSATLPGSSVPAAGMPGLSAYTPATAPGMSAQAPNSQAPGSQIPSSQTGGSQMPVVPVPVTPTVVPAPSASSPATPAAATPASTADPLPAATLPPSAPPPALEKSPAPTSPATPAPGSAPASRRDGPRPEPVVISSMPPVSDPPAFQERAGERNRQATRMGARVAEPEPEAAPASFIPATSSPAGSHTQGPLVSAPFGGTAALGGMAERPGLPNDSSSDLTADPDTHSELLRRAEGVQGLARTVGLLAVVLGLAAIALAYFQWQGAGTSRSGTLSAIWTLLAGGVGTVALLAFAEALRLLSALARSAARRA